MIEKRNEFISSLSFIYDNNIVADPHKVIFDIVYSDAYGASYNITYDGTTRVNNYCGVDVSNKKILYTIFQNHNLKKGALTINAHFKIPNDKFNDGYMDVYINSNSNIIIK